LQGKAVDSQEVAAMRNQMRRLTKVDVKEGRGAAAERNVSGGRRRRRMRRRC